MSQQNSTLKSGADGNLHTTNQTQPNPSNSNSNLNISKKKIRICRDFSRGICRRKHCRYPHVLSSELVVFCHDFQNSSCPRSNCKFLHYTLQEEEYYRKFGEFPQEFSDNSLQCIEYTLYGSCRHRECHISGQQGNIHEREATVWNEHQIYRSDRSSILPLNDFRTTCDEFQAIKESSRDYLESASAKRFRADSDRFDIMAVIRRFEEEQIMLRRRVEANELKIAELRASNEYLMSQNAQLRLNSGLQCTTVVNPVTVTQTTSQAQQIMGGVSIAPVQVQAAPIVSIATPQTQIIANSAQPLAIAANTSQGQQQLTIAQQNITSLSNASQPMAPTHTQQILGTSQITLTPTLAQAPSMGLTINTSQALAMSNATQPIISYPVMTHSILPH